MAINGISYAHADYLAAGGLGFILGDGQLNYGSEIVWETYYRWQVLKNKSIWVISRPAIGRRSRLQPRPRPCGHRHGARPCRVLIADSASAAIIRMSSKMHSCRQGWLSDNICAGDTGTPASLATAN